MSWREIDEQYAREQRQRLQEMTPEPLFEAPVMGRKWCLRCGRRPATSILLTAGDMRPVLPLCTGCAAEWNLHGYHALRGIRPRALLRNLLWFKLRHPLRRPSAPELVQDVRNLLRWVRKMKALRRSSA